MKSFQAAMCTLTLVSIDFYTLTMASVTSTQWQRGLFSWKKKYFMQACIPVGCVPHALYRAGGCICPGGGLCPGGLFPGGVSVRETPWKEHGTRDRDPPGRNMEQRQKPPGRNMGPGTETTPPRPRRNMGPESETLPPYPPTTPPPVAREKFGYNEQIFMNLIICGICI